MESHQLQPCVSSTAHYARLMLAFFNQDNHHITKLRGRLATSEWLSADPVRGLNH
ncbi:hypothetical protein HanXRQr2_Chr15g0705951 [Helianthus annuus]|uniref:Uncharacterized protein n=1 Tax=Helianthus annuus TaxID=4232 RepID=A0A9K3H5M0_HELAN|nr:hypothetical protein HanXRQr2_Chr15g0705951 [Helianthus annuus]KAJ0832333.1 hypothetical protein HanPSC8_Chr15g0677581 [Helianthus annuus]